MSKVPTMQVLSNYLQYSIFQSDILMQKNNFKFKYSLSIDLINELLNSLNSNSIEIGKNVFKCIPINNAKNVLISTPIYFEVTDFLRHCDIKHISYCSPATNYKDVILILDLICFDVHQIDMNNETI